MSHQTFVNGVTLTDAGWFQDTDSVVYSLFGDGTSYTGALILGASGNITVNSTKFTVTASSGNVSVAGTLGVTGVSTLGVVAATSIAVGGGTALANYTTWASFTPTLTLVGGSGNTVPTYTGQSFARWRQVGKTVEVDVDLTNATSGTAGAGTGQLTLALPVAVSATASAGGSIEQVGVAVNTSTVSYLQGGLAASATTMPLNYADSISTSVSFPGSGQSGTGRKLRLHFSYPVD